MHGAVDPAPPLRQQHRELVRHRGLAHGLGHKDLLPLRKGLEHQGREVAVLAQQQQVLLVQRVHDVLRVVLHHVRVREDGHPVVLPALGRLDPVHAEAAGQARDPAEDGLERLGEVVRDEVLEHLHHRHPRLALVRDLGLAAEAHDVRVLDHGRDHVREAVREDLGVGVDHEDRLVEVRRDARHLPDAVEHLELELGHALVEHDLLQERHEHHLPVALAAVAGLAAALLRLVAALDDDDHRHALLPFERDGRVVAVDAAVVVEAGVDLGLVEPLRPARHGDVRVRHRLLGQDRVVAHHAERDLRRREPFALALDEPVADDEDELVAVRVLRRRDRVQRRAEAGLALGVGRHEADDVRERIAERLPVRRRLRHDRLVHEPGRAAAFVLADERRRHALVLALREHEARTVVGQGLLLLLPHGAGASAAEARAVDGRHDTEADGALAIAARVGRQHTRHRALAGHRRRLLPGLDRGAFHVVRTGEAGRGREEGAAALAAAATTAGTTTAAAAAAASVAKARRGSVDVVAPVLDLLLSPTAAVPADGRLGRREAAAVEPAEEDGQEELGADDGEDEGERDVKHHLGRDAADGVGVDRADPGDLGQAAGDPLLARGRVRHGDVDATQGRVRAHVVELGRHRHLRRVEPAQQVEVDDAARVDDQVPARVVDVGPGEVDLAGALEVVEGAATGRGGVAAVAEVVGHRRVGLGRAVLVEGGAGEVPGQVAGPVRRHVRALGGGDEALALAVDVLEEEAAVAAAVLLGQVVEHVGVERDAARGRMVRGRQLVGAAVEDHVAAVDVVDLEPQPGRAADGLGEAEGQEADKGADHEDDADEAHLLAPGALLRPGRLAEAAEHRVRAPEGDDGAVNVPQAGRALRLSRPVLLRLRLALVAPVELRTSGPGQLPLHLGGVLLARLAFVASAADAAAATGRR